MHSSSSISAMASFLHRLLLLFTPFLLLPYAASSLNITHLLEPFPDYSSFNSFLSKYGVASQISHRQTITVLCPSNSVIDSAISSLGNSPSAQTVYNVLSYHVLLDYYDLSKLKKITNGTTNVPTMFQTTGLASGNHGFLNITDVGGVPKCGVPNTGSLTTTIGSPLLLQPYNISLLTIDSVLIPVDASVPSPAPTPSPSSTPTPTPSPSSAPTPASTPSSAPSPAPTSSTSPTPSSISPSAPASPGTTMGGSPASSPQGSSAASIFSSRAVTIFTVTSAAMLFI